MHSSSSPEIRLLWRGSIPWPRQGCLIGHSHLLMPVAQQGPRQLQKPELPEAKEWQL